MKISTLKIENFKALRNLEINSIGDMIVLAGPNGCGKTCILDAIRLLKSAYGGYIPNETQSWLNEFGITHKLGHIETAPLLHDRTRSLTIEAQFSLSESEIEFLKGDISELVRDMAVNESPDSPFHRFRTFQSLAQQARQSEPAIQSASVRIRSEIEAELNLNSVVGRLTINPDGIYQLEQSRLLELIFSTFKPSQIGVLDFQTSSRHYKREASGSIQVKIDQTVDETSAKARSHSLYNHDARYTDLKQQLSSAYVKALIRNQAGNRDPELRRDLTETLKELFKTFIPGKTFHGPQPSLNGTLKFDVTTSAGGTHDINDLSSGEKEVLYGYLLLSNRAPKNSILMIDEPELHLNPRLVADLPAFYSKHLGKELGNQIWLVTHSDAIVRGAIATTGASVIHLQPADTLTEVNQATSVVG
ncbi:MAG: AAA family ATPase, partial [Steroidobacteraceae bacterium]